MNKRIHVAVGVIYNSDKDKVLISKRTTKQHLAGLWEFPGGKVEKDEDTLTALTRELYEELNIIVNDAKQLTTVAYDYSDKKVLLDVWEVNDWTGKPTSKESQEIVWSTHHELKKYDFPEANQHIIQTLSLSPLYVISQDSYQKHDDLLSVASECFLAGLKIFQLRLNSRNEPEFSILIKKLRELTKQYDTKLILNGVPSDINTYDIDGVHLNAKELQNYKCRPIKEDFILGASCHNEEELAQAEKINVNYVFLSPVERTRSHPEKEGMGWGEFSRLSKKVKCPVYALGGMNPSDLSIANSYNAFGVAMISAIWNSNKTAREIISN